MKLSPWFTSDKAYNTTKLEDGDVRTVRYELLPLFSLTWSPWVGFDGFLKWAVTTLEFPRLRLSRPSRVQSNHSMESSSHTGRSSPVLIKVACKRVRWILRVRSTVYGQFRLWRVASRRSHLIGRLGYNGEGRAGKRQNSIMHNPRPLSCCAADEVLMDTRKETRAVYHHPNLSIYTLHLLTL